MFLLKMEFPSILVARQRTSHVLYLLSISLLQNIANTLFDTIGEIKGPLLYYFRFEMILNSWLLSQKCRQPERTSLRDGLRLQQHIEDNKTPTCICNEAPRFIVYVY